MRSRAQAEQACDLDVYAWTGDGALYSMRLPAHEASEESVSTDEQRPMTEDERAKLWRQIEAGRDRLHPIEVEIARGLMRRPLKTWCVACGRMLRRIAEKATQ